LSSKVTFAEGGTDAQVMFTTQNSGTVYYKIKFKVVSMAGVTDPNGGYLAGFAQNNTTFGGTLWTKRIDDNTFNLGISKVSNYSFSYNLLAQSASTGILSQQFVLAEGGFKSYINGTVLSVDGGIVL
jgi:hypothetical protein